MKKKHASVWRSLYQLKHLKTELVLPALDENINRTFGLYLCGEDDAEKGAFFLYLL